MLYIFEFEFLFSPCVVAASDDDDDRDDMLRTVLVHVLIFLLEAFNIDPDDTVFKLDVLLRGTESVLVPNATAVVFAVNGGYCNEDPSEDENGY